MYKMYLSFGNKQRSTEQERHRLFILSDTVRESTNNTCVLADSKSGKGIGKRHRGRLKASGMPSLKAVGRGQLRQGK